jgi:4-hydroxy-2-oxoheptanedioate aldolase
MTSLRKMLDAPEGRPLLGLSVMYPSPGAVERIGPDWDWMWLDGQHGEMGYEQTLALVRACDLIGRPAVVRVPGHEFGGIGKALDMGAAAVITPVVDTVEHARAVVDAAKFPPLGKRSYGGRRPIDFQGRNYADTANRDTLLIAQIESPQAIENADAIAAVDGVDALFLGPDDLMLRRGFSMTSPKSRETLGKDMDLVIGACRKHGKVGVMVGVGEEMLRLCLSMGFQMIVSGSDVGFLAGGSKQASNEARAVIGNTKATSAEPPARSVY